MWVVLTILIAIALQLLQWRYSKKSIDNYKLIAQEWRETAETLRDESDLQKTILEQVLEKPVKTT